VHVEMVNHNLLRMYGSNGSSLSPEPTTVFLAMPTAYAPFGVLSPTHSEQRPVVRLAMMSVYAD
jgi:hypothetical protein